LRIFRRVLRGDLAKLRLLLGYIWPHKKGVLVSAFSLVCLGVLEPGFAALMEPLMDEAFIAQRPHSLIVYPLLLVGLFIIKGLAEYISKVSAGYVVLVVTANLRSILFRSILELPLTAFREEGNGRLISRIMHDMAQVSTVISQIWAIVLKDIVMLVGLFLFLFYTSWQITLILAAALPLLAVMMMMMGSNLRRLNRAIQVKNAGLIANIIESFRAVRDIKIFDGFSQREKGFEAVNTDFFRVQMTLIQWQSAIVPSAQILSALAIAPILILAMNKSAAGQLSPGQFVSYVTALILIFDPVRRLSSLNALIQRGMAGVESFQYVTQHEALEKTTGKSSSCNIFSVAFEEVEIYDSRGISVIRDFTRNVDSPSLVIIKGKSGSGKTSLLDSIPMFCEIRSGRILINGRPLSDWDLSELRSSIATVSQDVFLIEGLVSENVALGESVIDNKRVLAACRKAGISQLMESRVTKLGGNLSGGQRQRLSLARAFYSSASLVLLDEPFSALDKSSAESIRRNLVELSKEKIVIMSSHLAEDLISGAILWDLDNS
jgi:subfamily B ATP-binding cassette protein MsbA